MTRLQAYNRVLALLNTNSSAYPQTKFNNDFNDSLALRSLEILRLRGYKEVSAKESYRDFNGVTGLSEGQTGYNGEFLFPADLLELYRIDVTFNNVDWKTISKENGRLYDLVANDRSEHVSADINNAFSESNPMATILRRGYRIRPLNMGATVPNGIHLFYAPRQADVTDDSVAPVFEPNLHQTLVYDCAELETISQPDKYRKQVPSLLKKKNEVDRAFTNFYRVALRAEENFDMVHENFE